MTSTQKALLATINESARRGGFVSSAELIDFFLAALPPSIVVDGRVVELVDVTDLMDPNNTLGYLRAILDSAREVAS